MSSTAMVTGASSGIGREIAKCLGSKGHDLILVARREELLRELAESLAADHGCKADVVVADLADPRQVSMVKEMIEDVDILVNNAGYGKWGMLTEQDEGSIDGMVDVNVRALTGCLLYTSPSPRDLSTSRMPSSA